jgi:hypothetical protein
MLRAALLSVTGKAPQEIADRLAIPKSTVLTWLARKDVKLYMDLLVEDHAAIVGQELLKGELEAVDTVRAALSATTDSGKPDWNVRLRAALRLLDAAGARGKPVEQVEQKTVQFHGNVDEALTRALLDPAVQEVLKRTPSLAKAVPALPEGAVPPTVPVELKTVEADYEVVDD